VNEADLKLLLVDDGTASSQAVMENLSRAGLPASGKAMLVHVGPPTDRSNVEARMRTKLSGWQFSSEELKGPPEDAILSACLWWSPDLLILGAGAHIGPLNIVHHARCSVRIVTGEPPPLQRPVRLLIGNDGSRKAAGAVSAVAGRCWPKDTEARILSVLESSAKDLKTYLESSTYTLANQLSASGLVASRRLIEGDPARELGREAERWNADVIFLGANGTTQASRFLLGGVSTAVVTRAQRPVEIVRG
jgi:nucleotide-binding universal stress UspA family protein